MSKFSAHLSILATLVLTARRLAELGVPGSGPDEDNNWSSTKEEMELYLGRDLNDKEITLLSLSRAFEPTPLFSDISDGQIVTRRIWPQGNGQGLRYAWDQLVEELIKFRDGNDDAVFVHASGLQGVYIVELCGEPGRGYLAEEDGDSAWFGDAECPSSYEMGCLGWFGPREGGITAEKAIRSLTGYPVDSQLVADVVQFQLLWDQGRMEEAKKFASDWHSDAFAAQLWKDVTPDDAWNRAVAALIKLRAVVDDLPACNEQRRCREALTAMGIE